jgi:rhodanese-related sulfurtransferase
MKTIILLLFLLGLVNPSAMPAEDKTNATATVVTHVDAKAAAQLVAAGKVTVLDVRTAEEFAGGHIAGATNVNFMADDFTTQVGKLDHEKTYLLHCASGGRSKRCLPQLQQLGFKQIIHLDGGFAAWEKAGNPVAKP